jgi:sporadic carbohydrate cluster protein (TIGR04323 family)
MKTVRGYNFSRSFLGERVPQHIQNIVIKDFCKKKKLNYLLSVTEYSMKESNHMLKEIIREIKNIDGIVAYSIFQMPKDDTERKKIFFQIVKLKKIIFFANESLKISNKKDIERIEQIWQVRKNLDYCVKIEDYGNVKKFCN